MSVSMLAPVVVNPETTSKKPSRYDGIAPLIKNGSVPSALISSQDIATVISPSLTRMLFVCGFFHPSASPTTNVIAIVMPIASALASP